MNNMSLLLFVSFTFRFKKKNYYPFYEKIDFTKNKFIINLFFKF